MENKLSDFEVIGKLGNYSQPIQGQGAYSSVYKVTRIQDGKTYALKMVKLSDIGEREKQNALNEVRIIASIQHPNIVSYKECFIDSANGFPELCIIMEYADDGDLLGRIQSQIQKQYYMAETEIWNILCNILLGLKALHDRKILHRDLKCANVFMFSDQTVKLGDFNVSKLAKKGLVYTQTGTPYYASPEVWQDKPYDLKADIWSLGCVIYEATTLKPYTSQYISSPFRAKDMDGLYKAVMKGVYPPIPKVYSNELSNVIKMMLSVSPDSRPDCDKLLQVPALKRKIENSFVPEETISNLLKTIKWPQSKNGVSKQRSEIIHVTLQLPASNYNTKLLDSSSSQQYTFKRNGIPAVKHKPAQYDDSDMSSNPKQTGEAIQKILNQLGKLNKNKEVKTIFDGSHNNSNASVIVRGKALSQKNELAQLYPAEAILSKKKSRKMISEPQKPESSRGEQLVQSISINQSDDIYFDEYEGGKLKKIHEGQENKGKGGNGLRGKSYSKDQLVKLQFDENQMDKNYYVRDVISSIGRQQSYKLPVLSQHYSKQHTIVSQDVSQMTPTTNKHIQIPGIDKKPSTRMIMNNNGELRQNRVFSLNQALQKVGSEKGSVHVSQRIRKQMDSDLISKGFKQ